MLQRYNGVPTDFSCNKERIGESSAVKNNMCRAEDSGESESFKLEFTPAASEIPTSGVEKKAILQFGLVLGLATIL
jgi:hypothetical protein